MTIKHVAAASTTLKLLPGVHVFFWIHATPFRNNQSFQELLWQLEQELLFTHGCPAIFQAVVFIWIALYELTIITYILWITVGTVPLYLLRDSKHCKHASHMPWLVFVQSLCSKLSLRLQPSNDWAWLVMQLVRQTMEAMMRWQYSAYTAYSGNKKRFICSYLARIRVAWMLEWCYACFTKSSMGCIVWWVMI